MDYIKLNVSKIRENVAATSDAINKFDTTVEAYMQKMINLESSWNDTSSKSFVGKVKLDKVAFEELIDSTKKHLKITTDFCDSLESAVSGFFKVSSLNSLKYIPSTTDSAMQALSTVTTEVAKAKRAVSELSIPMSSSCRSTIKSLFEDINVNDIMQVRYKIEKAIKSIEGVISSSKTRALESSDKYEYPSDVMRFVGRVTPAPLKKDPTFEELQYFYNSNKGNSNVNKMVAETFNFANKSYSYSDNNENTDKLKAKTFNLGEKNYGYADTASVSSMSKSDIDLEGDDYDYQERENDSSMDNSSINLREKSYSYSEKPSEPLIFEDINLKDNDSYSYRDKSDEQEDNKEI